MLNVTKELTALARKLGYTGKAPDTVAKAINAITASIGEGGGEGGGCDCEPLVVPVVLVYQDEEDESKYFYYTPENGRTYLENFYFNPPAPDLSS